MNTYSQMDVRLRKNENIEMQFKPEIMLYLVVDGSAELKIKDRPWKMAKDDFILVNAGLMHSITCEKEGTILCAVSFSCSLISELSGEEMNLFQCNSTAQKDDRYHQLRRIFHELVYLLVEKPHKTPCLKYSILYKMLNCLLENFRLRFGEMDAVSADDIKTANILQYINQNYAYNISLTELAERMYMSKSTLSRFFKKQTGIYFADYVNMIRLKYALEDLLYTDKNMTKIALDNGFSNPSAFNKIFREQYGVSPSEYRSERRKDGRLKRPEEKPDETLQAELKEKLSLEENATPDNITVRTDMACAGRIYPKKWGTCINIGSAYQLTATNLRAHTLLLKEQLGFTYARIWSVLSTKLTISDGKTKGYYNYDKIDIVLDFLVSNHIKPILDFGNRPDTATYAPGNPVFLNAEYIPFDNKQIWQDLIRDFILHITNRYGVAEASGWIFEFSYFNPASDIHCYYKDEHFNYFEAFSFAWHTIKHYLPDAQTGGPMSEIEPEYAFVKDFLCSCKADGFLPDFVSFMLFPYHTDYREPENFTVRATSVMTEKEQVKMMHSVLEESGAQQCRLYITEWNDTLSNRSYLNDSCSRASYLLKKVSEIADQTDLLVVWMASDWMSSYFDTVSIANGSSGILTKDSIRKPAYHALDFLQRMGNILLDKGANHMITKKQNGEYYILCYNYKWFSVSYFVHEESIRDPEQLHEIFEDKNSLEMEFILENMSDVPEYTIKRRTVNDEYGSLLTEWKNFQYDSKLRSTDIDYIRECCIPKVHMSRQRPADKKIRLQITLKPHEITLLHIYADTSH